MRVHSILNFSDWMILSFSFPKGYKHQTKNISIILEHFCGETNIYIIFHLESETSFWNHKIQTLKRIKKTPLDIQTSYNQHWERWKGNINLLLSWSVIFDIFQNKCFLREHKLSLINMFLYSLENTNVCHTLKVGFSRYTLLRMVLFESISQKIIMYSKCM